jgi:fibronectin-binding autotransporter adhesin
VNRVYRLVWNRGRGMFVPVTELSRARKKSNRARSAATGATRAESVAHGASRFASLGVLAMLFSAGAANADTFLDLSNGLTGWTTAGGVTTSSSTVSFNIGGKPFSLTPAAGYDLARIAANGGPTSPNATLGLSASSLETFLNTGGGHITNFGLMTKSFAFNVGTYSFSWAYAAEDYQPFNDGAVFSLVGNGSQSLISLVRNGSSATDKSGPSPNTLILGSYGSTSWLTTSFDITTAGNYQVGFASYNWNDQALAPNLFVSGIDGTFTGTAVQTSGGTPPVIGGTGGNVAADVYSPTSTAYSETTLTFEGGTLQYTADITTAKNAVLNSSGGSIDTNGMSINYTGAISGTGNFQKEGAGTLVLTNNNTFTGDTIIGSGTLALAGSGDISASNGVVNDGTLDISGTTDGTSLKTMSGGGTVELGDKTLTLTNAAGTFTGAINGAGAVELAGGELTLSGINTYTGDTVITGGTLKLASLGNLAYSSKIVNDGVLDLSGLSTNTSISKLSGAGIVNLGSNSLTVTNAADIYSGSFAGTGSLNLNAGTLTLTGDSTYSGGTHVANGAILIASNSAALGDAASTLTLNGATFANASSFSLLQKISLAGTSAINTNADTSITSIGEISGNGNLVKAGSGTLVLAANNSNFGLPDTPANIVVNDGTLEITNVNGLGNANVILNNGTLSTHADIAIQQTFSLGSNTTIDTANNTVLTIDAPIASVGSNNGCFEKAGAGTLVMTGQASIAMGTCVQAGKLYANGLLNSLINVQLNGVLRGTGVINGAVTVRGKLAPGNSPGVLQATAPITMTAGSTYQEDINGIGTSSGPGSYSRLIISGAGNQFVATGATLEPNLVDITGSDTYTPYVPKVGDAFRIVMAEGGIVGEFASVTQPEGLAAATRMEVYYNVENSNSIDLFVIPTSYGAYAQARSGNENTLSAAASLDALMSAKSAGTATGSQDALLYAVSAQSDATLEATTTALAGEVHSALVAAAPMANRWLVDSVGRELSHHSAHNTGAWVDVGANRSDWNSDSVASGFDTTRSQVAIGWNLVAGASSRLGVGFTHGKSDVSAATGSGSVTHDIGFVYGQIGVDRVIVDGVAAFGGSDWETDRPDPIAPYSVLTTDFGGHDALIAAGVRLPLNTTALALSPYARATWERFSRDGFNEGAGSQAALSTAGYSASGTRWTAGLLGGSSERNPLTGRFTYRFNLGAGYDAADLVQPAFDVSLAGVNMLISTPDVGRTFVFGQATTTARLTGRLYGYLGVSGEARSGKSKDLGANLGVRMTL